MEFFMKKVSIYSLLFALIAAVNPLQIKANNPQSLLSTLISNPSILFFSSSTLALGIGSIYFFKKCRIFWNKSLSQDGIAEARVVIGQVNAAKQQEPSIEAKNALKNAKTAAFYGTLSLFGAGYSVYQLSKAIQQARS
jgi:hypothetical protein